MSNVQLHVKLLKCEYHTLDRSPLDPTLRGKVVAPNAGNFAPPGSERVRKWARISPTGIGYSSSSSLPSQETRNKL